MSRWNNGRIMPDSSQLPHLIRLLDDDTELVQKAVREALAAYGPELEAALRALPPTLDERQNRALQAAMVDVRRNHLRKHWPGVFGLEGDKARLEQGLSLIAGYQMGPAAAARQVGLLDGLAEEFYREADAVDAV